MKQNLITGIILQPFCPNVGFDGDIIFHSEANFAGVLSDCWGEAIINGKLSEQELYFEKKYSHRKDSISYFFQNKGDLWIGSYKGDEVGVGEAQCELYTSIPKVNWKERLLTQRFSQAVAEENAKCFADWMIKNNHLETYRDNLTGETMVYLPQKK